MAVGKYQKWLEPDNLILLEGWARDGLTEEQIAKNIGVSVKTLFNWKKTHLPILHAIKKGKEVVDYEVENALLKSALGFSETIRKPFKLKRTQYNDSGKKVNEEEYIEYADEDVYVPPNVTAQIYWLNNRKPEQWRNKPKDELNTDRKITVVFEDAEGEDYAH